MNLFYLSKYENDYILRHEEYPDVEICIFGEGNSDLSEEDLKKVAMSSFVNTVTNRDMDYISLNNSNLNFYDETWMDGKLCRVDWAQGTKEGQEIVLRLKDEFPDETIYDDSNTENLISQYVSDRPDYPNELIHYYSFEEPSDETKTRFGLTYDSFDTFENSGDYPRCWYALKLDRTTKEVKCKVVLSKAQMKDETVQAISTAIPEEFTRQGSRFFAKMHDEDKSVSSLIDFYFVTTPYIVKLFCEDQGLSYPYGDHGVNKEQEEKTFCWGVVYDEETESFKHMKGYARFYR